MYIYIYIDIYICEVEDTSYAKCKVTLMGGGNRRSSIYLSAVIRYILIPYV